MTLDCWWSQHFINDPKIIAMERKPFEWNSDEIRDVDGQQNPHWSVCELRATVLFFISFFFCFSSSYFFSFFCLYLTGETRLVLDHGWRRPHAATPAPASSVCPCRPASLFFYFFFKFFPVDFGSFFLCFYFKLSFRRRGPVRRFSFFTCARTVSTWHFIVPSSSFVFFSFFFSFFSCLLVSFFRLHSSFSFSFRFHRPIFGIRHAFWLDGERNTAAKKKLKINLKKRTEKKVTGGWPELRKRSFAEYFDFENKSGIVLFGPGKTSLDVGGTNRLTSLQKKIRMISDDSIRYPTSSSETESAILFPLMGRS